MIARSDQPGLRVNRYGVAAAEAPWASAELVERARRVFSRLYGRPVTVAETRGMLDAAGRVEGIGQEKSL